MFSENNKSKISNRARVEMSFETISVIGLGYIGLPTAAMFAAYGKKSNRC
jgi:UDP-N-acetyl-D-mannosaminuronate dehydrogenase